MTQKERRIFLIRSLLAERAEHRSIEIPSEAAEQKQLLRALMNVRPPVPADAVFLKVQDEYLQAETAAKGVTDLDDLTPADDGIYLWQGDITTLRCDAIVNAANSGMLGCFCPCHGCIDNAVHSFAGVELRLECAEIMAEQESPEPTGRAKLTKAHNLPCRYVLHTVGPMVEGEVSSEDEALLSSCYRSCLELAAQHHLKSVAFCCISTGEFRFPNRRAAEIAVSAVKDFKTRVNDKMKVIFNVFKEADYEIYRELLGFRQKTL